MSRYKLLDARIPVLGCQQQAFDNSGSLRLLSIRVILAPVYIHSKCAQIATPRQNPNTLPH